jgi:hypothetical protein
VLYRSETVDGGFEEAYRLCPKGHAPRYCTGFENGRLCPRLVTVHCGLGYYCKEHSEVLRNAGNVDREGTRPTVESAFLCDFRPSS